MSESAQAPTDNTIAWQKGASRKGKTFHFGAKKSREKLEVAADDDSSSSSDDDSSWSSVDVDWKVGTSGNPSQDVQDATGIRWYSLQKISTLFRLYDYELDITTSKAYNYLFRDESQDEYSLNCYVTGNHYVQYNSDQPNIVKIFYS
jgi:hypothetical protein